MVYRSLYRIAVPTALLAASGCLTPQSDAITSLIAASSSSSTATPSVDADLYIKVSTAWETIPGVYIDQFTCTIPRGSATVSTTCSGSIPEGQLYFSKIKFTVGAASAATCKVMVFRPYYYQLANTAAYAPPWDPTASAACDVNDSARGTPSDTNCYDGVGTEIVPGFPDYVGVYHLTVDGLETTYEADSSNGKGRGTNRYTCNNKVDQTAGIANYLANSMQNYIIECRDEWYNLTKRITMTLNDEDLEAGEVPGTGNDDMNDWLAP